MHTAHQCMRLMKFTATPHRGIIRAMVHNCPLPNLFVSMLQRMGIDADKFATSTGTMRGLEMT